jgi:3-isopropylmalate dehydrogenase
MLRWSFSLGDTASAIERAVIDTIGVGVRTPDIAQDGSSPVSTSEFGNEVARRVEAL